MLVVTTTVGMLNGVHRHTTNLGPGGTALHLELVVVGARLEHGLVAATATRNLPDGAAAARRDSLLGAGGKLDAGEAGVGVVGRIKGEGGESIKREGRENAMEGKGIKLRTGNLTCYIFNSAKTHKFFLAAKTVNFLTQCSVVLEIHQF